MTVFNIVNSQPEKIRNKIFSLKHSTSDKDRLGRKIYSYLTLLNDGQPLKRQLFLLDQGSDINIISLKTLKDAFPNWSEIIASTGISTVNCFNNSSLQVQGAITLNCSFINSHTEHIPVNFIVIDSDDLFCEVLLGEDFLRQTRGRIEYKLVNSLIVPEVLVHCPALHRLETTYLQKEELNQVYIEIELEPFENKQLLINPPHFNTFDAEDLTLLSLIETSLPDIHLIPTKNRISDGIFACIMNTGNKERKGVLKCKLELLDPKEYFCVYEETEFEDKNPKMFINEIVFQDEDSGQEESLGYSDETAQNIISTSETNFPYDHASASVQSLNDIPMGQVTKLSGDSPDIDKDKNIFHKTDFGFSIPPIQSLKEIINLDKFQPTIRPYLEDLFIKRYPDLISRSNFDVGNLSRTLGYIPVRLKKGAKLPTHSKLYYCNGDLKLHLSAILEFLQKHGIIEPVSPSDIGSEDVNSTFASPAYLIAKSGLDCGYRFIVDFSLLNTVIRNTPSILPKIDITLNAMRSCVLFSCLDLTQSYYSLSLDEQSKPLTRFVCSEGRFQWNRLPQGLSLSASTFSEIAQKMVHCDPVMDGNNQPIFLPDGTVKLVRNEIDCCAVYLDDVLLGTKAVGNHAQNVAHHFKVVDKLMKRLAFHKAKISFRKCSFAKSRIKYLGWSVERNILLPDPKRIEKLVNFPKPHNVKTMRIWLGTFNTLKQILPLDVQEDAHLLTPLTSNKASFPMSELQSAAFERMKKRLISKPLFANLIDPNLTKVIFTDAACSRGSAYGAVLGQLSKIEEGQEFIPEYINIDDPVHQILYSEKLNYQPVPYLYIDGQVKTIHQLSNSKFKLAKQQWDHLPLYGFNEDNYVNSIFISLQTIAHKYKINILSISDFRKQLINQIKGFINIQILSDQFNNNREEFRTYIHNFQNNLSTPLDSNYYMLEALAPLIRKRIVFINTTPLFKGQSIVEFGEKYSGNVFIISIQLRQGKYIFSPFFSSKRESFELSKFKNRLELIGFFSKKIQPAEHNLSVFEREVSALLLSLEFFKTLIAGSEIIALTDSNSMFLCFSKRIWNQSLKINRWVLRLNFHFPRLKLFFIPTSKNIADILTRFDVDPGQNRVKFKLKQATVSKDIDKYLDHEKFYTFTEFQKFVEEHQDLIEILPEKEPPLTVNYLNSLMDNLDNTLKPFYSLKAKLSLEKIQLEQRKEFKIQIEKCHSAPNFQYKDEIQNCEYKLMNGLLFIKKDLDYFRIYVPPPLISPLIFFKHLLGAHCHVRKLRAMLSEFYFPKMSTTLVQHIQICFGCFLNNKSNFKSKLGVVPFSNRVGSQIMLDLAEDLNTSPGTQYKHVLVACCSFSHFIWCFPLKTKNASEVVHNLATNLFPYYNIESFLTDNGSCFSSKTFYRMCNILNIKKIVIAAYSPMSNPAESVVKRLKLALRKHLVYVDSYSWVEFIGLLVKQMNTTINLTYNLTPMEMLYGKSANAENNFDLKLFNSTPINDSLHLELQKNNQIRDDLLKRTKEIIIEHRKQIRDKANKNKSNKEFKINQIAFTKDRHRIAGSTQPLKSYFSDEPFIVAKNYATSVLLYRPATCYYHLFRKDDVKIFDATAKDINITPEIRQLCVKLPETWTDLDFIMLRKNSNLDFPLFALPLQTEEEVLNFQTKEDGIHEEYDKQIKEHIHSKKPVPILPDEFFMEEEPDTLNKDEDKQTQLDTKTTDQTNQIDKPNKSKKILDAPSIMTRAARKKALQKENQEIPQANKTTAQDKGSDYLPEDEEDEEDDLPIGKEVTFAKDLKDD